MKLGWVLLGCVIFVGCGDDDGATDAGLDAGATDGGGVDASGSDASSDDASTEDASADVDASDIDADTSDAGDQDAATEDGGPPGCDYVAVEDVVARCDGRYTFVTYFSSTVDGCEPFWGFSLEGPRFEDAASAIGSDPSCDAGCIYDFAMSFSRIYCGRRTGYERLTSEGCPDVYRFDTGWYASVEEHDAAHPCE